MTSYLDLPTYVYDQMTPQEKEQIITKEFYKPVVIRGLYKPNALKLGFEKTRNLFGNERLPVEVYRTPETGKFASHTGRCDIAYLTNHWKKDKRPYLYCAEVDLIGANFQKDRKEKLLSNLKNPNTPSRGVQELLLYLGKNHTSGLHLHVGSDFILNQLFGSKTIYIFSNYDNPNVRKNNIVTDFNKCNFAVDDFFKMDHSKMKIYKATLEPGDSITIPPWYWHATQGHGLNMSITQTYNRYNILYLLSNPNIILDYITSGDDMYIIPLIIIIILVFYMSRKRR
jgi:hypothetical protein|tara:strand:+ start:2921 stop:3772 length:852 start_codon:yes stop_codon:yes gene_type:complete